MSHDNVIELQKTTTFIDDPITEVLRQGARKLFAQALETEIANEKNLGNFERIYFQRCCIFSPTFLCADCNYLAIYFQV